MTDTLRADTCPRKSPRAGLRRRLLSRPPRRAPAAAPEPGPAEALRRLRGLAAYLAACGRHGREIHPVEAAELAAIAESGRSVGSDPELAEVLDVCARTVQRARARYGLVDPDAPRLRIVRGGAGGHLPSYVQLVEDVGDRRQIGHEALGSAAPPGVPPEETSESAPASAFSAPPEIDARTPRGIVAGSEADREGSNADFPRFFDGMTAVVAPSRARRRACPSGSPSWSEYETPEGSGEGEAAPSAAAAPPRDMTRGNAGAEAPPEPAGLPGLARAPGEAPPVARRTRRPRPIRPTGADPRTDGSAPDGAIEGATGLAAVRGVPARTPGAPAARAEASADRAGFVWPLAPFPAGTPEAAECLALADAWRARLRSSGVLRRRRCAPAWMIADAIGTTVQKLGWDLGRRWWFAAVESTPTGDGSGFPGYAALLALAPRKYGRIRYVVDGVRKGWNGTPALASLPAMDWLTAGMRAKERGADDAEALAESRAERRALRRAQREAARLAGLRGDPHLPATVPGEALRPPGGIARTVLAALPAEERLASTPPPARDLLAPWGPDLLETVERLMRHGQALPELYRPLLVELDRLCFPAACLLRLVRPAPGSERKAWPTPPGGMLAAIVAATRGGDVDRRLGAAALAAARAGTLPEAARTALRPWTQEAGDVPTAILGLIDAAERDSRVRELLGLLDGVAGAPAPSPYDRAIESARAELARRGPVRAEAALAGLLRRRPA